MSEPVVDGNSSQSDRCHGVHSVRLVYARVAVRLILCGRIHPRRLPEVARRGLVDTSSIDQDVDCAIRLQCGIEELLQLRPICEVNLEEDSGGLGPKSPVMKLDNVAGYHRLWSHTSYKASLPLQIYLAAVGVGAVQGSIRWWSRGHRAHHRYTDTEKDPYSVRKGLLYSHLGWMVIKQNPKNIGRSDITDLNEDPVVIWQHRHYLKAVLFMALIFPTLICGLGWGDWWGGFIYAGIIRSSIVQQATFCVNSLAHWLGDQPFDDRNSPRDHVITALVTLGEGYHNYHHEFPSDYRNGIEWWQYDPTKWCIWVWKKVGLATDLKQFRQNEIDKGRVQQLQKKLDQRRSQLDWGTPISQLPIMAWDDFIAEARVHGKALVVIAGIVHDVAEFVREHPGGRTLISSAIGKDATAIFNGGVYQHSNAAHNLLSTMRVGVICGGGEVEIWKRASSEKANM